MATTVFEQLRDAFVQDTRDDGSRYTKLGDNAPDWIGSDQMREIHEALDDRMPDDWVYDTARRLADGFTEYDCETADQAREIVPELADVRTDVYNSDLLRWLCSHQMNVDIVNEFAEEFGWSDDLSDTIRGAQCMAIERIGYAMVGLVEQVIGE